MKGFNTRTKIDMHDALKMSAVKLFLAIIEGTVDMDIYRQIADSMDDFAIFTQRMEFIYERFLEEDLGLDPNSDLSIVNNSL